MLTQHVAAPITMMRIRPAAVAGRWYPGTADGLAAAVDRHLAKTDRDVAGELVAIVAPHAGLMYSGPVAAHAYRVLHIRDGKIEDDVRRAA